MNPTGKVASLVYALLLLGRAFFAGCVGLGIGHCAAVPRFEDRGVFLGSLPAIDR